MNIIGYYKIWTLIEQEGIYYVVDRRSKQILCKSEDEELATKVFVNTIIELWIEKNES